jgi:hypothetical protein
MKILGNIMIVALIISFIFFNFFPWQSQNKLIVNLLAAMSFLSGFSLWIWMFTDLFRNKHLDHRITWGWSLVFLNIIAAMAYFLFIYRKKNDISKK